MERIELVNGIECLIREDENVIEYTSTPRSLLDLSYYSCCTRKIPEDKKFPKNVTSLETMATSYNQTWQDFDNYFDEALNRALHPTPQSLGSSSSVMRPCTSDTSSSFPTIQVCMVPTHGTRPLLHAMLYHQIARAAEHHYKGPAPTED
ncbi:hypothetical protein OROHE_015433 [Orobanche hederae]